MMLYEPEVIPDQAEKLAIDQLALVANLQPKYQDPAIINALAIRLADFNLNIEELGFSGDCADYVAHQITESYGIPASYITLTNMTQLISCGLIDAHPYIPINATPSSYCAIYYSTENRLYGYCPLLDTSLYPTHFAIFKGHRENGEPIFTSELGKMKIALNHPLEDPYLLNTYQGNNGRILTVHIPEFIAAQKAISHSKALER